MKTITQEQYYLALAYYLVASKAQSEVRKYQEMISDTLGDDGGADTLGDAIYDPDKKGNKKEYDDLLFHSGVTIEWKESSKKKDLTKDITDVRG